MEGIGLPERRVIGELDLAVQPDVDVVEEGQVKRLADHVRLALGQVKGASVVGILEALQELIGDVVGVVGRRPDPHRFPGAGAARLIRVLHTELGERPRDTGWELDGREYTSSGG